MAEAISEPRRIDFRRCLLRSLPPGLGHLRERVWGRGLSVLAGFLFLTYVVLDPTNYAQPPPLPLLGLAGAAIFLAFWIYAARDLMQEPLPPPPPRGRSEGPGSRVVPPRRRARRRP